MEKLQIYSKEFRTSWNTFRNTWKYLKLKNYLTGELICTARLMLSLKFHITWTTIFRQNIRFLYKYVSLSSFIFNEIPFFFFEELSQFSLIWDHKFWLILRKLFKELEQRWIFLYNTECLLKILLLFKSVGLHVYFKIWVTCHHLCLLFSKQYGPSNQRQLKEACLVVDVLDSKIKKDLLAWFVKLQLSEYLVLFGEKEEVSMMKCWNLHQQKKKNSLIFPKSHIPVHVNYDLITVKQGSSKVLGTSRLILQQPTSCISLLWFC